MATEDVQLELREVRITMSAADPSTCTPVSLETSLWLVYDFTIVFVGWSTYDNCHVSFLLPKTHRDGPVVSAVTSSLWPPFIAISRLSVVATWHVR